jgi:serine/threonine protein kinase
VKFIELYHDAFSEASTLLVMELCSYGTLQTRIDQATPHMAHGEILRTTRQIAQALEYMHALKLYHSDVKPRNILIRALHPIDAVLADCADVKEFGRRGKLQGTPAYWSPEMRARNMHCGPADDVWALGITLLGMVGQWPQMMYSKRDLEKYPERCFEHVCKLDELNPAVGVVGLLRHLLVKEAWERMSAADCVRGAGNWRKGRVRLSWR